MIRRYSAIAVMLVFWPAVLMSDDNSKDGDEKETPPRENLIRFYDTKRNEHIYTYGEGEPQAWREREELQTETILGKVALTKEPGTTPLYRAVRKDGKHYFYLIKPTNIGGDYKLEDFHVYVWTKPGDGRIPMHACVLPDSIDLFLDNDLKKINEFNSLTLKGIGQKRRTYMRMFYIYPPDPEDLPEGAEKPKAGAKKSEEKSDKK
jgi:hypothetical protein